jgi:hypothetical protein
LKRENSNLSDFGFIRTLDGDYAHVGDEDEDDGNDNASHNQKIKRQIEDLERKSDLKLNSKLKGILTKYKFHRSYSSFFNVLPDENIRWKVLHK